MNETNEKINETEEVKTEATAAPEEKKKKSKKSDKALEEKQAELDAMNDKYLRLAAEYDNFRRRSAKEREGVYADAYAAGGEKYAEMLSLAYRQVIAGHKLVLDENDEVIRYFGLLVKEFFGKDIEKSPRIRGGRGKMIKFISPACEKYILSLDSAENANISVKCPGCESAFFSGVFLACGRVANPQKR